MLSRQCHYALRAALELALREDHDPVTIRDIATSQSIPARFLEAILRQLKLAGLLESERGKEGGYRLAKPAGEITIGQILRVFQEGDAGDDSGPVDVFTPVLREAMNAQQKIYDSVTLRDIAAKEVLRRDASSHNYTI